MVGWAGWVCLVGWGSLGGWASVAAVPAASCPLGVVAGALVAVDGLVPGT